MKFSIICYHHMAKFKLLLCVLCPSSIESTPKYVISAPWGSCGVLTINEGVKMVIDDSDKQMDHSLHLYKVHLYGASLVHLSNV